MSIEDAIKEKFPDATIYEVRNDRFGKCILGVRIANICRFIDKMKKNGNIRKVSSGKCPISHRKAGFYTSNREYFKDDKQPSLFCDFWNGIKLKP